MSEHTRANHMTYGLLPAAIEGFDSLAELALDLRWSWNHSGDRVWREFARECLIFEVCQPQQAKKVLDQNMSISTALPCRISIYEEGGKTMLATLKPTTLLAMFNTPQLEGVAQKVEDTIVPGLPYQRSYERRLSFESRHATPSGSFPSRHRQPARDVQSTNPRRETFIA